MKYVNKYLEIIKDNRVLRIPMDRSRSTSINSRSSMLKHQRTLSDPGKDNIMIDIEFWKGGIPMHIDIFSNNYILLERWIIQFQNK